MSNVLEKEIEAKLKGMVENYGGFCLKWVCPGWTGVPDRIVLLPGGCIHFVELKRPEGGRLSAMQRWWHNKLRSLGFPCWVIKDERDLGLFKTLALDKVKE